MHFWGTGNIDNQDFDVGEHGNMAIYFRGTREHVPLGMTSLIIVILNHIDLPVATYFWLLRLSLANHSRMTR